MIHTYKPLEDYLDVLDSSIHGKGLFATKSIKKGTVTRVSHVHIKYKDYSKLFRTPTGGFINHSEDPDVRIISHPGRHPDVTHYKFEFLRDIEVSSYPVELTINYKHSPCVIRNAALPGDDDELLFQ